MGTPEPGPPRPGPVGQHRNAETPNDSSNCSTHLNYPTSAGHIDAQRAVSSTSPSRRSPRLCVCQPTVSNTISGRESRAGSDRRQGPGSSPSPSAPAQSHIAPITPHTGGHPGRNAVRCRLRSGSALDARPGALGGETSCTSPPFAPASCSRLAPVTTPPRYPPEGQAGERIVACWFRPTLRCRPVWRLFVRLLSRLRNRRWALTVLGESLGGSDRARLHRPRMERGDPG
jgi:hypothetical protein